MGPVESAIEVGSASTEQACTSGVLAKLVSDESGQDLIEYALVAALVGLGAVTAMKGLSTHISEAFNGIGTSLTSAV